ncbi:LacI family DNA-binding transcriptional regulator [Anaerocolumna sp. AGMB13020]|uniref:LacI family DNA-binding transcriptional regulator n=1 Tax=Anaerocolumna sp. AGMB13020 TaxID=3081750 RepID=UPI0029548C01|nr:LacI family DNA-binding transcriptional regulator [Anaerocolumna sp. AGMB13020]WOO39041.1 LacI family DNA-binding transcriptional regulator [Anaerocolumna sp. AGMB13020]
MEVATLKDVAKETGLTVSTISRVLNNRGYISEETRQNVYDAMKRLNYQPNEVARSLSKKSTNTIGVIVPHIRHPYFAELISNLENQAYLHKYKILLFNSKEKDEKEREYLEMCTSNRVSGVILCSGTVAVGEFSRLNIPLVTIERYLENGTASIECDNLQGGRLAAKHLMESGCEHLIHFSGVSERSMPADARGEGFREVCSSSGIDFKEVTTSELQYNNLEYHDFIENILKENPDTDGIFASSDLIAAQVIQVCAKMKISIPDQLKIVGFDDVYLASLTTPRITTIHQPVREMAQMAIELVIAAGEGKLVPNRTMLPVSLIKRETT